MKEKNCSIVFLDKTEYDFAYEDIAKALKFAWDNKRKVWAVRTIYGIFQPMSPEEFDNVFSAVMSGPVDEPIADDLV